jgi:hypothetical protein
MRNCITESMHVPLSPLLFSLVFTHLSLNLGLLSPSLSHSLPYSSAQTPHNLSSVLNNQQHITQIKRKRWKVEKKKKRKYRGGGQFVTHGVAGGSVAIADVLKVQQNCVVMAGRSDSDSPRRVCKRRQSSYVDLLPFLFFLFLSMLILCGFLLLFYVWWFDKRLFDGY